MGYSEAMYATPHNQSLVSFSRAYKKIQRTPMLHLEGILPLIIELSLILDSQHTVFSVFFTMRFHLTSIVALQFTSAALAAAPAQLRVTIAHWRRPEYTHEEFVEQFVEPYVPRITELMKKYDITHVSTVSTPSTSIVHRVANTSLVSHYKGTERAD